MSSARFAPSEISRTHDKKCVCQICKCGGHKCPSQHNRYPDNLIKTTFQKDFIPFDVKPSQPFKEKKTTHRYPYEKDQLKTQYNSEFQKFPITKDEPFKIKNQAVQNDLPFTKSSEYSTNYAKFPNCKRDPFKQSQNEKLQMPFMGRSTYKNDFNKHNKVPKNDKLDRNNYNKTQNWFTGGSTYSQDFKKWNTKPADPFKVPSTTKGSPPLDGLSMYQSHYLGFDPRIYERDVCPIDQLPPRPKQLHPGHDHLTFQNEKMEWD